MPHFKWVGASSFFAGWRVLFFCTLCASRIPTFVQNRTRDKFSRDSLVSHHREASPARSPSLSMSTGRHLHAPPFTPSLPMPYPSTYASPRSHRSTDEEEVEEKAKEKGEVPAISERDKRMAPLGIRIQLPCEKQIDSKPCRVWENYL